MGRGRRVRKVAKRAVRGSEMADKMVQALMLAIKAGGIRDLSWDNQCLVAKSIQILKALPPRFDDIDDRSKKTGEGL